MTDDAPFGPSLSPARLERIALHHLARFETPRAHLARVLNRRLARAGGETRDADADAAAVTALCDRLSRAGWLDDARYARGRAAALHRRGLSRRVIAGRLRDKGVPAEVIDAALSDLFQQTDDPDLAAAWALARRRRLGPYRPAEDRAARRHRDMGVLARAGFSRAIALAVLDGEPPEEGESC